MYPGRMRNVRAYERSAIDLGQQFTVRKRFSAAEVNAGATLATAPATGLKLRLNDITLIAIGGAAAGATSVDVLGTQNGASVKLLSAAVAGLTQSSVLRAGAANAAVLADGKSFLACDAGTPITVKSTGTLTGATSVDVIASYSLVDPTST